jgi:hypothetical protein
MNINKIVLLVLGIISFISSIFGWLYSLYGNASGFTPYFFWMGIFTWDDGMIIGTFLFIICIFLWFKNNSIFTGLFLSTYAMIRSLGEVIYNLNAQFSPISRPWESKLPAIASSFHLQLVELFVVGQIFFMVICITSFLILLYYIKKYLFILPLK